MSAERWLSFCAVLGALCCAGCTTFHTSEYYLFSGQVVDAETGEPVPRAAIYIAESEADFFAPPRIYREEVPWYVGSAWSKKHGAAAPYFGRDGANRYLALMADDEGRFETVWRRDIMASGLQPLSALLVADLESISFAVGAPGYEDAVDSITPRLAEKRFAGDVAPFGLPANVLKRPVILKKGESALLTPLPLQAIYLKPRLPAPPAGVAGPPFRQAEQYFKARKYRLAMALYDDALEEAPDHPLALLRKLEALYKLHHYGPAVELGRRYTALYPEVGMGHKLLADAAQFTGEDALRRERLIKAMQLDPELQEAYASLVSVDEGFASVPDGWLPPEDVVAGEPRREVPPIKRKPIR